MSSHEGVLALSLRYDYSCRKAILHTFFSCTLQLGKRLHAVYSVFLTWSVEHCFTVRSRSVLSSGKDIQSILAGQAFYKNRLSARCRREL